MESKVSCTKIQNKMNFLSFFSASSKKKNPSKQQQKWNPTELIILLLFDKQCVIWVCSETFVSEKKRLPSPGLQHKCEVSRNRQREDLQRQQINLYPVKAEVSKQKGYVCHQ